MASLARYLESWEPYQRAVSELIINPHEGPDIRRAINDAIAEMNSARSVLLIVCPDELFDEVAALNRLSDEVWKECDGAKLANQRAEAQRTTPPDTALLASIRDGVTKLAEDGRTWSHTVGREPKRGSLRRSKRKSQDPADGHEIGSANPNGGAGTNRPG